MGKKAAKTEAPKAEPVAQVAETPAKPLSGGVMGALAMMKKAGAKSTETASKGDKVTLALDTPDRADLKKDFDLYILESVKIDAADGRRKAAGERLRAFADKEFYSFCRQNKQFIRSLSIEGAMTVSFHVQTRVANPTKENGLSKEQINAGLLEIFGEEKYAKYVEPSLEVKVAPEYATAAGLELLQNKLGIDLFQRMFPTFELGIALKKEGPDKDAALCLKKDMALDPVVETMAKSAEAKGFLSLSSHTLYPLKEGKAKAEAQLLKEAMEVDALRKAAGKTPSVEVMATAKVS